MALPSSACARGLCRGIDMQHEAGYLGPFGAVGRSVKEPHIGDEMILVVGGQSLGARRNIGNGRIERGLGHVAFCVPNT